MVAWVVIAKCGMKRWSFFGSTISSYVVIPSTIAEVWMVGYLLVIGVRTAKPAVACGAPGQPACELT